MIKNISLMRKELEGFERITTPYGLKKGFTIKYLTLKDNDQCLNKGGDFVNLGNNCVVLKNKNKTWSVPICILNPDGTTKCENTFFVKEKEDKLNTNKETKELNDIIQYQQRIIDTMTETITELELNKKKIMSEKNDYEDLLQQNRYNMKELSMNSREKDKKIKKYEEIIQKLANSHQMYQD